MYGQKNKLDIQFVFFILIKEESTFSFAFDQYLEDNHRQHQLTTVYTSK